MKRYVIMVIAIWVIAFAGVHSASADQNINEQGINSLQQLQGLLGGTAQQRQDINAQLEQFQRSFGIDPAAAQRDEARSNARMRCGRECVEQCVGMPNGRAYTACIQECRRYVCNF